MKFKMELNFYLKKETFENIFSSFAIHSVKKNIESDRKNFCSNADL